MKIGVLGSLWHNIPPRTYGGTEYVIYNLVNGLANKGHEVVMFGPKTANVYSRVYATVDTPLRERGIEWTNVGYSLLHITKAFDEINTGKFDVFHVHLNKIQDYISLPLALFSKTPVLFTIHFKLPNRQQKDRRDRYLLLKKYAGLPYTSISDAQRKDIKLNFIATIYNAVDPGRFPFSERIGSYLVWLGKVNPLKGTKEAILAAKRAGIRIYVMGAVEKGVPHLHDYFKKEVRPLIDGKQVIWLGEVSHAEKASILSGAKVFLNPIQWEEPFGLVMVEAQAVGTPVISYRRGAAPELIQEGKTGFLVDNLDEMVQKITEVEHLDRKACRINIEKNFTLDKMIEGYENAYRTVIENWEEYKKEQQAMLQKNRRDI